MSTHLSTRTTRPSDIPAEERYSYYTSVGGGPVVFATTDNNISQLTKNAHGGRATLSIASGPDPWVGEVSWTAVETGPSVMLNPVNRSIETEDQLWQLSLPVRDTAMARRRHKMPLSRPLTKSEAKLGKSINPEETGQFSQVLETKDGETVKAKVLFFGANCRKVRSDDTAQLAQLGITSDLVKRYEKNGWTVHAADCLIVSPSIGQTFKDIEVQSSRT